MFMMLSPCPTMCQFDTKEQTPVKFETIILIWIENLSAKCWLTILFSFNVLRWTNLISLIVSNAVGQIFNKTKFQIQIFTNWWRLSGIKIEIQ